MQPAVQPAALACPDCKFSLRDSRCDQCGRHFESRHGIHYLLPGRLQNEAIKTNEREGWKRVYKENQWQTDVEGLLTLPESGNDEFWRAASSCMPAVHALLDPLVAKTGIDVACGIGWGALRFAGRGAEMYALEFNDSEQNGLMAAVRARQPNMSVHAVCCDCEELPLVDASADFAFISSALHHFTRPQRVLQEVRRVLKHGGVVVDICEAIRTGFRDEQRESRNPHYCQFRRAGINEQMFFQSKYEEFFEQAGFEFHALFPWEVPSLSNGRVAISSPAAKTPAGKVLHALGLQPLLRRARMRFTPSTRLFVGLKR